MPYKTLIRDLTVPRSVGKLTDLFGNEIGDQIAATVYAEAGTVLEDDQVAPHVRDAVDNGDMEGKLEKVGDSDLDQWNEAREPFPGYNDLEVEEVQAILRTVPSDFARSISKYEADHGENRAGIADWHIGRGEAYTDRLSGLAGSPTQDGEEKEIGDIVTRNVTENDVRFGESYQDDGTPLREPGELKGDDRHELEKANDTDNDESKSERPRRRGRRSTKTQKPAEATAPAREETASDKAEANASEGDNKSE